MKVSLAQSRQYLHGWVRVVTNGIRADPRPRCEGLFGFVCFAPQSHGTQRGRCVCMRGICDVPHRIREEVPGAIYVEAPLNQVDAF